MPNMVTETVHNPENGPDWRYYPTCRVCGANVADWQTHKAFHQRLGDALEDNPKGV